MGEKSFPQQISLGQKSVGWVEEEIQNWIQGRIKLSHEAMK